MGSRGADELNTSLILGMIRTELAEYQSTYDDLPPLELCGVWVNGSFGAGEADEMSDVDITVEVGVVDSEYDLKPLHVADRITGLSGQVSTVLSTELPALPDVTVIPSKGVLRDAGIDAPTAEEHVKQTQRHGEYDSAFDVHSGEYVQLF